MKSSAQDQSAEFEAAVLDSFKFLEEDYGFLRNSSRPEKYTQLVIYKNPTLYVTLSYGPPEYEPEMSFGRRGIDDVPGAYSFHPGDLLQLDSCRSWTWNKDHGNALASWVAELARLMAVCGMPFLAGDPTIFSDMKSRRDMLVTDWNRDERTKAVRTKIELAWRKKDYAQVLRLYESIDDLSMLDKKRIAFAAAHI